MRGGPESTPSNVRLVPSEMPTLIARNRQHGIGSRGPGKPARQIALTAAGSAVFAALSVWAVNGSSLRIADIVVFLGLAFAFWLAPMTVMLATCATAPFIAALSPVTLFAAISGLAVGVASHLTTAKQSVGLAGVWRASKRALGALIALLVGALASGLLDQDPLARLSSPTISLPGTTAYLTTDGTQAMALAFYVVAFIASGVAVRNVRDGSNLLHAAALGGLFVFVAALPEVVSSVSVTLSSGDIARIRGPFGFWNELSLYAMITSVASTGLLLTGSKHREIVIASLISSVSLLLLSGSRIAWLGTLVGVVILVNSTRRANRAVVFASLAASLLTVLAALSSLLAGRAGDSSSTSWRLTLWNRMLGYGFDSPILGNGFGSFRRLTLWEFGNVRFRDLSTVSNNVYEPLGVSAHNELVRAFVEGGIVGVGLLLLLAAGLLECSSRRSTLDVTLRTPHMDSSPAPKIVRAMTLAWLVTWLSDNTIAYVGPSLPLIILTSAVSILAKRQCENTAPRVPKMPVMMVNARPVHGQE